MSYRWVEHTAEVELEIEASSREGVFADALRALRELIMDDAPGERRHRELTVEGGDPAALLAEWLNELVFLAESEDLVPEEAERLDLSERRVTASVRCRTGRPRHLVKGATYHRLVFERTEGGYRATVVLDV
jgi:SHS2 domain-containing protein